MNMLKSLIPVFVISLSLGGCSQSSSDNRLDPTPQPGSIFTPGDSDIRDPDPWYENAGNSVLKVELKTVIEPGGYSLNDVNGDIDPNDDFKPEIKVHFRSDDFPDDGSNSNATLRLRGNTSRLADQKSYRIKLDSKKNLWRGERRLQLNKHPWDVSRVRNKLSFDIFNSIPHLPSLRTQFVHLFINEQDYGLFTHVEYVGKEYLVNRDWDEDSNLYKAEDFSFRYSEALKLDEEGQPVDEKAFEQMLEIKRGKDHRKLLEMTTAIEDESTDFPTVFSKYFNRNNYLSWLAATILTGNWDTDTQNFYLYNPADSDLFYFIPWDYDDSWGYDLQLNINGELNNALGRWQRGVSNWWDSSLHRRFLQQPGNLDDLVQAVNELRAQYLTDNAAKALLGEYQSQIKPLISQSPDIDNLPVKAQQTQDKIDTWQNEFNRLIEDLSRNQKDFVGFLERPMPFYIDPPTLRDGILELSWTESYDLQGDQITYNVTLASSPDFNDGSILMNRPGLTNTTLDHPTDLALGSYFLRIIARDDKHPETNWQTSYSRYEQEGLIYHGIREFSVDQ